MHELDVFRNSRGIDPVMSVWGWEIPVYLFLGGLAAGVMVLGAWVLLRPDERGVSRWIRYSPLVAPVLISLGMLALFLDLEHKSHVYRFYLALRPLSPMSWGAWILVALYPIGLLLGLGLLESAEVDAVVRSRPIRLLRLGGVVSWLHGFAQGRVRQLAWANLVTGVGLGAYTGLLLGTLAARAAWNSVVLGPLFLTSGVSTGAALMMLLPLAEHEHERIRRWDVVALATELGLLALLLLSLFGGGQLGRDAAQLFVGGRLTGAFWTLVVVGGLAIPLGLELLESRRHLRPTVMTPALILIGGLALRWVLTVAGQA